MAVLHRKMGLVRGLLTGEVAKTGPFYVDVDLSRRCNLRCLGCLYHSPLVNSPLRSNRGPSDISVDLVRELCRELKTMNTRTLILQGAGEPLMHPRLLDIISIVKEAGFHVTLLTNGTLLDRDVIQALIDMRVDTVKVSLWASSAAQYEMNYPGSHPDNFNKVLNGLRTLSTLKAERGSAFPNVIVYHVINRHNFRTIDSMVDFALSTECDGLFFSPVLNVGEVLGSLKLSTDEERIVEYSLLQAKKRLQSLSIAENVSWALLRSKMNEPLWRTHPCYVAWFHARIRVDGRVQPCGRCDLGFGTLGKNTFKEIWNGSPIRAFRRKSLTRKGMASMSKHCDCRKCCFVGDILRVDKVFKWIRPLVSAATVK